MNKEPFGDSGSRVTPAVTYNSAKSPPGAAGKIRLLEVSHQIIESLVLLSLVITTSPRTNTSEPTTIGTPFSLMLRTHTPIGAWLSR